MNLLLKRTTVLTSFFTIIALAALANIKVPTDTITTQPVPADTVGPLIQATVQFKYIDLKRYESNTHPVKAIEFPKSSELSIIGSDSGGVKEIYISVDHAAESPYRDPIRLTARGRHTARIRAVDNVGNETMYSFDYVIRE